jgi:hypothetical protein
VGEGRVVAAIADEQLVELLDLTSHSDSVELKLTIPLEHQRKAVEALGMDPLTGQMRLIHFFETPDLALEKAGVVVRARRIQGKPDDSVIKLRPVVAKDLPADLRESPSFFVEVDAMPGGFVCSGSMKGVPRKASVWEVFMGEQPLRKLFSKEQRAFYERHAPEGLDMNSLSILGPIAVFKLKTVPAELGRKLVGEMWLYPDYSRILELSTKCAPPDALAVAAQSRDFLSSRGIDLDGEQQTKTKTALEFFISKLES